MKITSGQWKSRSRDLIVKEYFSSGNLFLRACWIKNPSHHAESRHEDHTPQTVIGSSQVGDDNRYPKTGQKWAGHAVYFQGNPLQRDSQSLLAGLLPQPETEVTSKRCTSRALTTAHTMRHVGGRDTTKLVGRWGTTNWLCLVYFIINPCRHLIQ